MEQLPRITIKDILQRGVVIDTPMLSVSVVTNYWVGGVLRSGKTASRGHPRCRASIVIQETEIFADQSSNIVVAGGLYLIVVRLEPVGHAEAVRLRKR